MCSGGDDRKKYFACFDDDGWLRQYVSPDGVYWPQMYSACLSAVRNDADRIYPLLRIRSV